MCYRSSLAEAEFGFDNCKRLSLGEDHRIRLCTGSTARRIRNSIGGSSDGLSALFVRTLRLCDGSPARLRCGCLTVGLWARRVGLMEEWGVGGVVSTGQKSGPWIYSVYRDRRSNSASSALRRNSHSALPASSARTPRHISNEDSKRQPHYQRPTTDILDNASAHKRPKYTVGSYLIGSFSPSSQPNIHTNRWSCSSLCSSWYRLRAPRLYKWLEYLSCLFFWDKSTYHRRCCRLCCSQPRPRLRLSSTQNSSLRGRKGARE